MDDRRMRVARKVAHLRRLGADPSSTNEAAAARALADQLVARYALTPEELAVGERASGVVLRRPAPAPAPVQRVVVYVVRGWGWGFGPFRNATTTATGTSTSGWWTVG